MRSTFTGEFGVPRPTGLAYVPQADALVVAGIGAGTTPLLRLGRLEDALGSSQLPRLSYPSTLAFDRAGGRLTAVTGGELLSVPSGELSRPRPATSRAALGTMRLRDPRGAAFDPSDGTWFVLDGRTRTIVRAVGADRDAHAAADDRHVPLEPTCA